MSETERREQKRKKEKERGVNKKRLDGWHKKNWTGSRQLS